MAKNITTKITQVGGSLGVIIPKDVLRELNAEKGDEVTLIQTERGLLVTPYDPKFERTMAAFERVTKQYRNALKELAK
jgi:antitoxin MazE